MQSERERAARNKMKRLFSLGGADGRNESQRDLYIHIAEA